MFKRKNPIGLDIGSAYIKAVQLNDTKTGYELVLFDMIPIQQGVIIDGMVEDKPALIASIKELLKKINVKKSDAVIGVSGHSSVVIKRITIPLMTEEELGASMKYEAEQYVPFDINDVEIDFQILGPRAEEDGQMDVVLVAVKKSVIKDYNDVVSQAGLEPIIMDVDSFALSNMYEVNYGIEERKNIALVNIGASTTNINILQNGVPVFTRDSAIGSSHHTDALEKEFGIHREDAEQLKLGHSIEGISYGDVQLVINSASEEIYSELHMSFEYFKSSVAEEDIDKIILSGGASLIKGFSEAMADRLGIEVEVVNPFKNIKISEKLDVSYIREIAPIAAVAVGFGIRRAGDR
ncbi:pilus assembly protein PilM [Dissulfurispira thermophila]|uniref:Pilus assembly protein PilM n=1 Tax=Dissulfurispira thermophila TaxID=2715679 RepID=A0A7G1H1C7_9BACT|nr:type IV pilus assembly protein PilM [Dissulfurispira thermophila]BCB95497.1 pilus assembly protein PilM [Dissulfurispira thermophila]